MGFNYELKQPAAENLRQAASFVGRKCVKMLSWMFNFVIGKRLVNVFLKGSKMSVFQAFLPHFHAKSKGYKIHSTASSPTSGAIPVIMATRIHLFPFRASRALPCRRCSACGKRQNTEVKLVRGESTWHIAPGRITRCRISIKNDRFSSEKRSFFLYFRPFSLRLLYAVLS